MGLILVVVFAVECVQMFDSRHRGTEGQSCSLDSSINMELPNFAHAPCGKLATDYTLFTKGICTYVS